MTNAEKFKAIFGIEVENIKEINWNALYHKQKKYCVTMYDHRWSTAYEIVQVIVTNKTDAREKAINKLGSKYSRYRGSGRPMFALEVEEAEDD